MSKKNHEPYAIILAGGSGTRFWPKSRHLQPKQLCAIGDTDATMLELTLGRLEGIAPPTHRMIVTHTDQARPTRDLVAERCRVIIEEPIARNTAPALALAALEVERVSENPDQLTIAVHADAVIREPGKFRSQIQEVLDVADKGYLTLLGVKPEYPETGYGYIERGDAIEGSESAAKVASFREKPDLGTAEDYIKRGNFLWNSGIFAWKNSVFLGELRKHLPEMMNTLETAIEKLPHGLSQTSASSLEETYESLKGVSIDEGVLEKSDAVAVVSADFGWQDVGSWNAMDRCFETDSEGNYISGDVLAMDTKNCTIDTDGTFIATIGISDLVVVSARNAILVCPKDRSQEVKKVVQQLRDEERTDLV